MKYLPSVRPNQDLLKKYKPKPSGGIKAHGPFSCVLQRIHRFIILPQSLSFFTLSSLPNRRQMPVLLVIYRNITELFYSDLRPGVYISRALRR